MATEGGRRHRVLIADDQPDIRLLLRTRLALERDIEISGEAATGVEVLSLAQRDRPDAVILDLQMPVMTGEEAIPRLRELDPSIRILVYSAYVGIRSSLTAGSRPDAETAKGANFEQMVGELRRLLSERPDDLVEVDLGRLDVRESLAALEAWEARSKRGTRAVKRRELLALNEVLARLQDAVTRSSGEGRRHGAIRFAARRDTCQAARRALLALDPDVSRLLGPLRGRLVEALPIG